MANKIKTLYTFEDFTYDGSGHTLRKGETLIFLTPKLLDILAVLLRSGGEVVEKDDLMRQVWPDTFVEKNNLTQCIFQLRKALDATAADKFIETIPKRGYRFAAPITRLAIEPEPELPPSLSGLPESEIEPVHLARLMEVPGSGIPLNPRVGQPWLALGTLVALLFLIGMTTTRTVPARFTAAPVSPSLTQKFTIGVLPTTVLKPREDSNPASLLIPELTRMLNGVPGISLHPLSAIPRSSEEVPPHVNSILSTQIEQRGQTYRLLVQLTRPVSGEKLWEEVFHEHIGQNETVQTRLAERLAQSLRWTLAALTPAPLPADAAYHHEAYALYMQGRFLWEKRTATGFGKCRPFFQKAIEKDPNCALAYVGLANMNAFELTTWQEAEAQAQKALTLDPTLGEAHAVLGFIRMFHYWDWNGAEGEFRTALHLTPHYPTAHQWYATYLIVMNRLDEARVQLNHALRLDPLSPSLMLDLGEVYNRLGLYQEAADIFNQLRTLHPDATHVPFAIEALLRLGRVEEAVELYLSAPDRRQDMVKLRQTYLSEGVEGLWRAENQRRMEAVRHNARGSRETYPIAKYFLMVNEVESGLVWLERAYQERDFMLAFLQADLASIPTLQPHANHPKIQELLNRMGLSGKTED